MLIELRGGISLSSNVIGKLEGVLDKEIVKSCGLEALNLTKLRVPYSEMLCKSELIVEDIARRDLEQVLEEGWHWKEEDLCRFESSAKE